VGGEEARRVTAAVEETCAAERVRFWEGGFAGFASIISQCDFYAGYDSAGQHAAAAAGVPLISVFAGAPSERFRQRWTPAGHRNIVRIVTDGKAPEEVLNEFIAELPLD
jgi:ADP-heptose:LPS heptosyltransferase